MYLASAMQLCALNDNELTRIKNLLELPIDKLNREMLISIIDNHKIASTYLNLATNHNICDWGLSIDTPFPCIDEFKILTEYIILKIRFHTINLDYEKALSEIQNITVLIKHISGCSDMNAVFLSVNIADKVLLEIGDSHLYLS